MDLKIFENGTYTQDDILEWHETFGTKEYQNSLKNLQEDQFDNIFKHQDENSIYTIGEKNGVTVILNTEPIPSLFGTNMDDLAVAGEKTKNQIYNIAAATPGFLKDAFNPVNIGKGLNTAVVNFFDFIDKSTGGAVTTIDNFFVENFPNTLGKKFEYEEPQTPGGVTGKIIGQYVMTDLFLRRVIPFFRKNTATGIAADATTVGLFSSKDEGNIASTIGEMFPNFTNNNLIAKTIVEGLTADEDDSEVEGRLKNVISDSGALSVIMGLFKVMKSLNKNPEKVEEYVEAQSAGAAASPTTKPSEPVIMQGNTNLVKTNIPEEDLALSNYDRISFDESLERPFKVFLKGQESHQRSFRTQQEAEDFINEDILKNKKIEEENNLIRSKSDKPFYSNVENAISNFTFKQQPGNQILATLNNTAGIKQSELQDLGLIDFLKDKPKVTKEELDDFIADKSLITRVTDTLLEGSSRQQKNDIDFITRDPEDQFTYNVPTVLRNAQSYEDAKLIAVNDEITYDELKQFADEKQSEITDSVIEEFLETEFGIVKRSGKPTKFETYTEPGGENYKEMLITTPGTPLVYTKHHFTGEVPQGENLIAHARFNERTIDNKKILFIEEIQSDLHQHGKQEGYKKPLDDETADFYAQSVLKNAEEIKKLEDQIQFLKEQRRQVNLKGGDNYREEFDISTDIAKLENELNFFYKNKRSIEKSLETKTTLGEVADAPFKKNWYELTMKRLIKYAVDNGFDGISFTSGDMQIARYDGMENAEGLKGFYDNTLVKFTNKFAKKYGASLEETSFPGEILNPIDIRIGKSYAAGNNKSFYITGNSEDGYTLMETFAGDADEPIETFGNLLTAKEELVNEIKGFNENRVMPILIFPENMKKEILTEGVPIAQIEERENKQQTSAIV